MNFVKFIFVVSGILFCSIKADAKLLLYVDKVLQNKENETLKCEVRIENDSEEGISVSSGDLHDIMIPCVEAVNRFSIIGSGNIRLVMLPLDDLINIGPRESVVYHLAFWNFATDINVFAYNVDAIICSLDEDFNIIKEKIPIRGNGEVVISNDEAKAYGVYVDEPEPLIVIPHQPYDSRPLALGCCLLFGILVLIVMLVKRNQSNRKKDTTITALISGKSAAMITGCRVKTYKKEVSVRGKEAE